MINHRGKQCQMASLLDMEYSLETLGTLNDPAEIMLSGRRSFVVDIKEGN